MYHFKYYWMTSLTVIYLHPNNKLIIKQNSINVHFYFFCLIFILTIQVAYRLRIPHIRHLANSNWQLSSCLLGFKEKLETWEILFIKLICPTFDSCIISGVLHFHSVTIAMYSLNHSFHSTISCLMMKKRRTFLGKNKFEETVS